jgi:radical SAM superfamily enzyme YgiQ (UPF0313 family)
MRIGATQYNYKYGTQLHFPYSIASILANCPSDITYELVHCGIERERYEEDALRFVTCDVLLCSLYVWNEQITREVIRRVKALNRNVLVICGGPQVPDNAQDWLASNPEVNYVVHGEGEIALWEGIRAALAGVDPLVAGWELLGDRGKPPVRINDLAQLASPYLKNTVDLLTKNASSDIDWIAAWETNRGCPYQCLAGDALVDTVEGQIPIAELAKTHETIGVFTYDRTERRAKVATARNIRKIGHEAMVRVRFDDGTHLDCTPDHKFLAFKWGNQYTGETEWEAQAIDLRPGTRVRAKRIEVLPNGRRLVYWARRQSEYRSRLVAEWMIGRSLMDGEIATRRGLGQPIGNPYRDAGSGRFTGNHHVVSVEKLEGLHDVYCLEVSDTGWFYSNDVLVQNCTFCDWGSNTYTKLRQFPMHRLEAELEWFRTRHIPYIDCCDANFGILPRDLDIAKSLREYAKNGDGHEPWRVTFRQSWAKMSSEKVIPVAKALQEAGALTAVGLALESLDEHTLDTIKRKNLRFETFGQLTKLFRSHGLPTYTEIIRALPGETLASFEEGLRNLVENSDIEAIYIYSCAVLPNAPMADPQYRATHKIETVSSPIYLAHSQAGVRTDVEEYEHLVVSTSTASREDVEAMHLLSWMVITFHSLGLLRYAMQASKIPPMEFYKAVLNGGASLALEKEIGRVQEQVSGGLAGNGWGDVDAAWGTILWPIEETSWLRLTENPQFLTDLPYILECAGVPVGECVILATEQIKQWTRRAPDEDRFAFAKRIMWHGRRRGLYLREQASRE